MKLLNIVNQEQIILTLETASYEVQCRQNIINLMVRDGLSDNDNFKKFWNEYKLYSKAYDQLKYEFERDYIRPNMPQDFQGQWEVDFYTKEIKVYD